MNGSRFGFPSLESAVDRRFLDEIGRRKSLWHPVEGTELPGGRVWLQLRRDERDRLTCTGIVVGDGSEDLTATQLKNLPLAPILRELRQLAGEIIGGDNVTPLRRALGRRHLDEVFSPVVDPSVRTHSRRGPKNYDQDHFEMVALEYQRALLDTPKAPIQTMADRLGVNPATCHRWLKQAREMGVPRVLVTDMKRKQGWYRKGNT